MPAGVDVSQIQDRDGAVDVIAHLEHLVERSPKFLATARLDADQCRILFEQPREGDVLFILGLVTPQLPHPVDHSGEHVGHLLVGFGTRPGGTVRTYVEGDVSGVDHLGGLDRRLHLGECAIALPAITEDLGVIRPVEIHLELGLPRQDARLPVLVEVLRLDGPDGLDLHRLQPERGDIIHPFDDGSPLA